MFSVRSMRPPADVKQRHTCDPATRSGSRRVYCERINLRRLAARGCQKCAVDAMPITAEVLRQRDHDIERSLVCRVGDLPRDPGRL